MHHWDWDWHFQFWFAATANICIKKGSSPWLSGSSLAFWNWGGTNQVQINIFFQYFSFHKYSFVSQIVGGSVGIPSSNCRLNLLGALWDYWKQSTWCFFMCSILWFLSFRQMKWTKNKFVCNIWQHYNLNETLLSDNICFEENE